VKYFVTVNGRDHEVELDDRPGSLRVLVDGRALDLAYREIDRDGLAVVTRDGRTHSLSIEGDPSQAAVTIAGHLYDVRMEDERERAARAADRSTSRQAGTVRSVMPGVVVDILVQPKQPVEKGQPLLILSAMKMQNEIAATAAGVVAEVHVSKGEAVGAGTRLITFQA
jgi:biotin carboxyl carrier protein